MPPSRAFLTYGVWVKKKALSHLVIGGIGEKVAESCEIPAAITQGGDILLFIPVGSELSSITLDSQFCLFLNNFSNYFDMSSPSDIEAYTNWLVENYTSPSLVNTAPSSFATTHGSQFVDSWTIPLDRNTYVGSERLRMQNVGSVMDIKPTSAEYKSQRAADEPIA